MRRSRPSCQLAYVVPKPSGSSSLPVSKSLLLVLLIASAEGATLYAQLGDAAQSGSSATATARVAPALLRSEGGRDLDTGAAGADGHAGATGSESGVGGAAGASVVAGSGSGESLLELEREQTHAGPNPKLRYWVKPEEVVTEVLSETAAGAYYEPKELLKDDEDFWMSTASKDTLKIHLSDALPISGLRFKHPKTPASFKKYEIRYATDVLKLNYKIAAEGEADFQYCCAFQEITFPAHKARDWKVIFYNSHLSEIRLQYFELQVWGRSHVYQGDTNFKELPGNGKCADSGGYVNAYHLLGKHDDCQVRCALDDECPGYSCCSEAGNCMYYTNKNDPISQPGDILATLFKITQAVDAGPSWKDSKCYERDWDCPTPTFGHGVRSGCMCEPGHRGTFSSLNHYPWYTHDCSLVPCPANSIQLGGNRGPQCVCQYGYEGDIVRAFADPFYTGMCVDLNDYHTDRASELRIESLHTTTTTTFAARWWGVAVDEALSEYEPLSFELFTSTDGSGPNLAREKDAYGFYPKSIENTVIPWSARSNGFPFLKLSANGEGVNNDWPSIWAYRRIPIYYFDLGKPTHIRSARHECASWTKCPKSLYIVYSQDGSVWSEYLYGEHLQKAHVVISYVPRASDRYWGVAGAGESSNHEMAVGSMQLFDNEQGFGDDLIRATHTIMVNDNGAEKKMTDYSDEFVVLKDWGALWVEQKQPSFYVDFGSDQRVLSARVMFKSYFQLPSIVLLVSSHDGKKWRPQLVLQLHVPPMSVVQHVTWNKKEVLLRQRPATCATFLCPYGYTAKAHDALHVSCLTSVCSIENDRDTCCFISSYNAAKFNPGTGGGFRGTST
eukprot:TRINITY_DN37437_c0_g1_i1.p1 TRINITY_DN37437_c0_g1~~TRINITY_DN37437_c0_g1_i1.p1  ORF type:complete len:841 (+),score=108.79 TRINITY_DN37437_c0_g1_i1:51-2573(+)